MKFLKVDSIETAREKLISSVRDWITARELLPIGEALGKVLAEDVISPCDIPSFCRSTVDGYAVLSGDTAAASDSIPVLLTMKGQVEIGQYTSLSIGHGECVEIPTGGMLPDGADAVVMVEYSEPFGGSEVAFYSGVSYGENVVRAGEDAQKGALLLQRGKRLLPQDTGTLAAAGITTVTVFAAPRLYIVSTGDELIPPSLTPKPGQVRDINTSALCTLARKLGFSIGGAFVLPDDESILEQTLRAAMETSDVVVISGGSSKGKKDITRTVIDKVSSPGVYTHGLAIKPGKPTILSHDSHSRTVLAGLPGHPVSAMIVFELLLGWLLREITGDSGPLAIPAQLTCNVASSPGKLTCWPARLRWVGGGYTAEPVFGKSGLITTLTKADGYFTVERGAEGLVSGQAVLVHLF